MSHQPYRFVWPLCTRLMHWGIAISFFMAFLTSFHAHLFLWHIASGWCFGLIIGIRMLWGFIGPYHALFRTFHLNITALKCYFSTKITNRWRDIEAGHNPASSWFTLIVLGVGVMIVCSGIVLQGIQEGSGLLSYLNHAWFSHVTPIALVHQLLSYVLIFGACIHISGVLIEQFYHKTHMLFAMVSGYRKATTSAQPLSFIHKIYGYGSLSWVLISLLWFISNTHNPLTQSSFKAIDYKKEAPLVHQKCTQCHPFYPPFMLPKASWERLIDGLENHFGEVLTEQNITREENAEIRSYLTHHAAETSSQKLAYKTLSSLGEQRPLSMTKVPYWRETHEHISQEVFRQKKIKKASNCFACHEDFEHGLMKTF